MKIELDVSQYEAHEGDLVWVALVRRPGSDDWRSNSSEDLGQAIEKALLLLLYAESSGEIEVPS